MSRRHLTAGLCMLSAACSCKIKILLPKNDSNYGRVFTVGFEVNFLSVRLEHFLTHGFPRRLTSCMY